MGLFARMTTPAKAAHATAITTTSVKIGLAATVVGSATTKLGITIVTVLTATAISIGTATSLNNGNISTAHHQVTSVGEVVFQYPYQIVGSYDHDGDGWMGSMADEPRSIIPVSLDKRLIGPPPSQFSSVTLPTDHWVELKFSGSIIDGPGDDIFIIEWGANGEQAQVFLNDAEGNEYLIATAMSGTSKQQAATHIGLDIADIEINFTPCAIRIVGLDEGGQIPGFDLNSIRARIKIDQEE